MNINDVNLKRVEWNYNDNKEFNKYIKIFIAMSKQMGKDMSVYDYDYHKEDTIQSIKEDIKKWNKSNAKVLLYFNSNDEEIGYTFLMDSMYETIRAKWISELFVKPSFRNKGYGTTILTDVLNYLKEQKIQRAFLRVYEQNKGAKQLYERFGFTTFERVMGLGLENFKENQNIVYLDLNNFNIGNEGIIDWLNGRSEGQINKVKERFKKAVESTISKYPLMKLNDNIEYGDFKVLDPGFSGFHYVVALRFLSSTGTELNERTVIEANQFIDFINEVASKFNYGGYYIETKNIDTPLYVLVRILIGDSESAKRNYKKLDHIEFKGGDLKKIYNEVKKLIIPEIRKYLNLKEKHDITEVPMGDSGLENWMVGKAKSAKLIYISQDVYDDDESGEIYKKVKSFISYFNDKLAKNSKFNKYMIIDPNDDSYSLDIAFRNNPGKENMSIQQLSKNPDKFNSIKTVAIYQPEAVNGLHIFPEIYKFIMEEIDRCSKKRSYLTMFSEMPSVDNIFNTSIFDIIRDKLRGTGTNLEVVDGKLTLNTNKFYFKEDTKVLKTLYKLQWDEKSYNTLKDVKIPEFINMINLYRPKYESIKEQVSQYTLLPSEIYPSTADQKLASANKKRLDGLFQIAKKIEGLYENVYVDFVNSITKQLV